MSFKPSSFTGTLHHYRPRLTAFEHQQQKTSSPLTQPNARHTILFIGGLGDGYLHPTYPSLMAKYLPPDWSVAEILLSSSYTGWTTSSLVKDAEELVEAIKYFRLLPLRSAEAGAKIVLMGHSTGAQVCMEYVVGPWKQTLVPESTRARPKIDGIILQSGISDREGLTLELSAWDVNEGLRLAKQWVQEGRGPDILPRSATKGIFGAYPSAERLISLVDIDGDDDYFSSDIKNTILDRTFGEIGRTKLPICIFLSGDDEHMPPFAGKQQLLNRWAQAVERAGGVVESGSGVLEGAKHNLNRNSDCVREQLCKRVEAFVAKIALGNRPSSAGNAGGLDPGRL